MACHLHPEGSFDLADHPVPTGREEDWRFTPLKRLRGPARRPSPLGSGRATVEVDAADGVTVESVDPDDPRRGSAGTSPPTGSRRGPGRRAETVTVVTIAGRGRSSTARASSRSPAPSPRTASAGHAVIVVEPHATAHRRAASHRRRRCVAANVEVVVGDGAQLTSCRSRTGTTTPSTSSRPARPGRPRRDVRTWPSSLRRRRRAGQHPLSRTTVPAARPSCWASTSPTPASTSSTGCSSTTTRRGPQQRRLQGRAAGPGRPRGVDRRRADPQGRRGHRDLREQPQPGAHRRCPRRLRAEPRDRDRRDRGRRPRVAPPAGSTTSSCSTCAAAASPRTRRAAWSCTASSPTSSAGSASRTSRRGCSRPSRPSWPRRPSAPHA